MMDVKLMEYLEEQLRRRLGMAVTVMEGEDGVRVVIVDERRMMRLEVKQREWSETVAWGVAAQIEWGVLVGGGFR